jgi:hypothetical protein
MLYRDCFTSTGNDRFYRELSSDILIKENIDLLRSKQIFFNPELPLSNPGGFNLNQGRPVCSLFSTLSVSQQIQITQITTFQLDFQNKKLDLNSLQIHKIVALFPKLGSQTSKNEKRLIYSCVFGFD